MANIQQAAKWMEEGKRVKRSSSDGSLIWFSSPFGLIQLKGEHPGNIMLAVEDLLGNDWEIAE